MTESDKAPRISLCQLAFLDTNFDEDVEIATAVGAAGLGVIEGKIEQDRDWKGVLDAAGLSATICATSVLSILPSSGIEWWFPGPADVDERISRIADGIRRLGMVAPDMVFCLTGPVGNFGEAKARSIVVEALRWLAEVAAGVGTRIGIEPMREQLRSEWSIVSSLAECVDLLDEVGSDQVGIVFDVWHMWDSPQVHTLIPVVTEQIFGVQISDYRSPNRGPRDRVVAGDGVAGVGVLVNELREAGYDGWYDLELFSDDGRFGHDYEDSLWKLTPQEFAARQVEGFLRSYHDEA